VRLNHRLDRRRHREQYDALEAFSEILTHELGNRLGAARTGAEILSALPADSAPSRRASLTSLITESIDAALETVDDVARLMSAQAHPDHDAAPVGEVVHGVARSVRPVARRMGVRIQVREPLPDVLVDASRMRLVISNLLLNGARYADADEDERFVRVSVGAQGDSVRVQIRDNGIGIEEAERERIFRFHQRGRLAEDQGHGSGLGLAIVREAVAQMHGIIELESRRGEGSTFTIEVPAAPQRGA
jgi:signal transduction histidine kinase